MLLELFPGKPLSHLQPTALQNRLIVKGRLRRRFTSSLLIMWATCAKHVHISCELNLCFRHRAQNGNYMGHIGYKCGAISFSSKMLDAKSMMGTQPNHFGNHAVTVPVLDNAFCNTGTNNEATTIFAASPGKKVITQRNRDSTKPVCDETISSPADNTVPVRRSYSMQANRFYHGTVPIEFPQAKRPQYIQKYNNPLDRTESPFRH